MVIVEVSPGRWVARDTPTAAARAIITQQADDRAPFAAHEFHILGSGALIGTYPSLDDALEGVRTHVHGWAPWPTKRALRSPKSA